MLIDIIWVSSMFSRKATANICHTYSDGVDVPADKSRHMENTIWISTCRSDMHLELHATIHTDMMRPFAALSFFLCKYLFVISRARSVAEHVQQFETLKK
eukprot:GHVT01049658.1.p3 GENE.GHVT01049658.1~~GHVT01049658.1.p3  ORF type:complete len:100 (+),score=0.44 GHVT01049658.1:747-1046(+)